MSGAALWGAADGKEIFVKALAAVAGLEQPEARAFRRKLQEGFDEEATSCLMDASTYCLSIEIISECPGSLDLMREIGRASCRERV